MGLNLLLIQECFRGIAGGLPACSQLPAGHELFGRQLVVVLEGLVYPGVGGQALHAVVGLEAGAAFAPEHGGAHFGDGRVAAAQALHHGLQERSTENTERYIAPNAIDGIR